MDSRPRPRVFISYKHGVHSPELVREVAHLVESLAQLEVWFDELSEQELHNTITNRLLKTYFPDVLSVLVGLHAFLQKNLEQSDVILFLQPLSEVRTPKSPLVRTRPEATDLFARLRHFLQTFCLIWLAIIGYVAAPLFVFYFGIVQLKTVLQRESLPVWRALIHYWLSPLWWIHRKLTGRAIAVPSFDPRTVQLQRSDPLFSLISAVRSAFYYRVIYGVQLPPRRALQTTSTSWQQWEFEAAVALGLHPVRVALVDDDASLSSANPDLTLISTGRLPEDLQVKVLPHLTGRFRRLYTSIGAFCEASLSSSEDWLRWSSFSWR